jgi:putative SOS response-associated peptidase YedK
MINAGAEMVVEKPAFKGALKFCRCLVVADGFFDRGSRTTDNKKPGEAFFLKLLSMEVSLSATFIETFAFL